MKLNKLDHFKKLKDQIDKEGKRRQIETTKQIQ